MNSTWWSWDCLRCTAEVTVDYAIGRDDCRAEPIAPECPHCGGEMVLVGRLELTVSEVEALTGYALAVLSAVPDAERQVMRDLLSQGSVQHGARRVARVAGHAFETMVLAIHRTGKN